MTSVFIRFIIQPAVCVFAIFVLLLHVDQQSAWSAEASQSLRYLREDSSWEKLQNVRGEHPYSLPLKTAREAVEYAKQNGLLGKIPFTNLKEKGYLNWLVIVHRREPASMVKKLREKMDRREISREQFDVRVSELEARGLYWEVGVKSAGSVPSYRCGLSFKADGEIVHNAYSRCGYLK